MEWLWVALLLLVLLFIVLLVLCPTSSVDIDEVVQLKGDGSTEWFTQRDQLPQSTIPESQWYTRNWNNGWGPDAKVYPSAGIGAPSLAEVARHYLGLPYRHHHIPGWNPSTALTGKPDESQGLDCSNYTSWIYNYGRGLKFTSGIHAQAVMYTTHPNMQKLELTPQSPLFQEGDLLYFWRELPSGGTEISHVAMFTEYRNGIPYIIDSHGVGVTEHPLIGPANSWYENHLSHVIRIRLS